MSNPAARNKGPATRQPIQLSAGFIALLHEQLEGNRIVGAAVGGVHEGRQLEGSYALRILSAALVPVESTEDQ